jgi:hypothetical protein
MFVHHERMAAMRAAIDAPAFGRVQKVASGFSFRGDADFHANNIRVHANLDPLVRFWICVTSGMKIWLRSLHAI